MGSCFYPPRLKADEDILLRNLHISSYRTTAEFLFYYLVNILLGS